MNINVANISTLIHFMDGLNDPRFTMLDFVHDCGAPACALGWASTVSAFGKHLDECFSEFSNRIFGGDAYWHLFNGGRHVHLKTPQQWADHARAFLKSEGHEVAPRTTQQAEDFKRFMEAALRPVLVEATSVATEGRG